jgi:hypothetical protein
LKNLKNFTKELKNMDEITCVKTKLRQEQWEKLIADCQSSGLKVEEWCNKNNISRNSYYYWLRKIRIKACEEMLPIIPKQDKQLTFAKVEIQQQSNNIMTPIIIHHQSATIEIHNGANQQTIEAVLLALKNIC